MQQWGWLCSQRPKTRMRKFNEAQFKKLFMPNNGGSTGALNEGCKTAKITTPAQANSRCSRLLV